MFLRTVLWSSFFCALILLIGAWISFGLPDSAYDAAACIVAHALTAGIGICAVHADKLTSKP